MRDRFYIGMSIVCLAIVLIGFGPVYYVRGLEIVPWENIDAFSRYERALPFHILLHGASLTTWYVLFVVQPFLIANRRIRLHRALGVFGIVVAICVFFSSIYTVFYRDAYMVDELTARPVGNLMTAFAFAISFTAAILYRNRPPVHKRLMLIGSITMLPPALDRWYVFPLYRDFAESALGWLPIPVQLVTPIVVGMGMLLAVGVHDVIKQGRVMPPTIFGVASVFVFAPALSSLLVLSGGWANLIARFA